MKPGAEGLLPAGRRTGGEDPVGSISEQELWLFVGALGKRTRLSAGDSLLCSHANGRVTQYNTINKPFQQASWAYVLNDNRLIFENALIFGTNILHF